MSLAPECGRRLEASPSLAQRFRGRHPVAGLPAGRRTDGEIERGVLVLPDGAEQSADTCDVAYASQVLLKSGEPGYIALDRCMVGIKR